MNLWTGVAFSAVAIVIYGLSKLAKVGNEMVIELKGRIHSLDFSQITFAIDATIKNPVSTEITIQYPFIKIFYKGSLIASSILINETVLIAPQSQTYINGIKIPVSYLKLRGLGAELIQKLQNKTKITLQVEVHTSVLTGFNQIPFTSTEDITI
jgi:Late embryogenesis abundant protein